MYSNHRKKLIPLLLLAMIVLVSPVAAEENRSDLPTVKIVYWRSIDDLPLYVGVEKGFFKEAGVNVALEFIKGEPNVLAAVLRGDVSGGYISLASLIKLAEKKVPVKVVMWMGHAHRGTKCGIHVGAQSKYRTLQDLKGIRLATSGSINSKTMLSHALAKGGYSMQDIRPLWGARPDNPMQHEAALRSGGVDAFIV
ncbi:MAG: ABC transporter substrate-binding protein [Desulfobacteraceae bacterium]|jgi:ABC-type nitrate/sulfonate/bicarbonate transport system substrate-binding protein